MRKRGFTLIELLAVIVVLAIIAIIAIPVITNVIDKAKVGALKDSAYGILDAGDVYLANNLKDGIESNIKFTCNNNKCINDTKEINYKGDIKAGILILTTDSKALVCVDNGKNYALKLEDEKKVKTGKGTCGEYEEANGTFNIIEEKSAKIEELEKNNKKLEEENNNLKDFIRGSMFYVEYNYTGTIQKLNIFITGNYKLEVWGAQGGYSGGQGSYSSGIVHLEAGDILYVAVGSSGTNCSAVNGSSQAINGGYNGGGSTNCTSYAGPYTNHCGSGGGATHISTENKLLSELSNNLDSILIVAGGGGGSCYWNDNSRINSGTGGSGGGINGLTGNITSNYWGGSSGTGGSQTTGNAFGKGKNSGYTGGGGGGFYGGTTGSTAGLPGGGGSGYIGNTLLSNKVMYCYNCSSSNAQETKTVSTSNVSSSAVSTYAKSGNGYAKITLMDKEL